MTLSFTQFLEKIKQWGLIFLGRYYSFYSAIVIDNNDPENQGRVKVRCRLFQNDENIDGNLQIWVKAKGMMGGQNNGKWWIPSIGDTVFLEFEEGDVKFPYYSYGTWLKDNSPNSINQYSFTTPKGLIILLDDDEEKTTITNKEGFQIILTKDGVDMIKGDVNLGGLIVDTNTAITKLTVPTALGPSGIPINVAEFQKIIEEAKILFV